MNRFKTLLHRIFAPQKRPQEGIKTLLIAAGIYLLLLIWAIVFKFSLVSIIYKGTSVTLWESFLNGFRFFYFVDSPHTWRFWRGVLVVILNVLVFMPWGIYASFFYDQKRTIWFACLFSMLVECIQLFARFGVFSFEDIILNTLGAFLGVLIFQKYICSLSENVTNKVNEWVVRFGSPLAVLAYINIIVAMILYFS